MVKFACGIVVGAVVAMSAVVSGQTHIGSWQNVSCYTNDCIAKTLNELASDRAAEAKLTTWGNGAGALTYVWFRR
jgi:hypothetical protein